MQTLRPFSLRLVLHVGVYYLVRTAWLMYRPILDERLFFFSCQIEVLEHWDSQRQLQPARRPWARNMNVRWALDQPHRNIRRESCLAKDVLVGRTLFVYSPRPPPPQVDDLAVPVAESPRAAKSQPSQRSERAERAQGGEAQVGLYCACWFRADRSSQQVYAVSVFSVCKYHTG